jgi:hypothetical protein
MARKPDSAEVAAAKAKATRDYRARHETAVNRIATLRAARLARDAKLTVKGNK